MLQLLKIPQNVKELIDIETLGYTLTFMYKVLLNQNFLIQSNMHCWRKNIIEAGEEI